MSEFETGSVNNLQYMQTLELKRKAINKVSPSFCTAKWLQHTLYLQTGFNHSCHHPSPHKIPVEEVEANPAALHNSKFKKEQRKKMLSGERPKECDYCWNIEDLGKDYYSDRHTKTSDSWAWDRFHEVAESNPDDDIYPSYLEISFSNVCNFACAYCSPDQSSQWMADIKKNGPYPVEFGSHDLEHLKAREQYPYAQDEYNPYVEAYQKWLPGLYPNLKVFRFTGGEPTMSKEFWKTLDYIRENPRKTLEVSVNTNLGVKSELIDKLIQYGSFIDQECKEFVVFTSNESYGEQAEYVRDGLNYEYWISNIEKILSTTKLRISIMTTINVLSLPKFTDFLQDVINLRQKYNVDGYASRVMISFNYLRFPPHLQPSILDKRSREKYADEIEKFAMKYHRDFAPTLESRFLLEEIDQIKRFCDYLRKEQTVGEKYRNNFVQFITAYDERRGKNFVETFPEYELFWYDCVEEAKRNYLIPVKEIE